MEVSSHALVQRRVAGVRFAAAAFTNLSGEHLDYHKTMEAYREAKGLLFESLAPGATAALNAGQESSQVYAARTPASVLMYGIDGDAPVRATGVALDPHGTRFTLHLPGAAPRPVAIALVGRHNVENALAAASLAHALGFDAATIARGLESLALVPGRLEPVDAGQPFRVLVDYAHTDDALEKVLTSLRAVSSGRIVCLFGCGGDRDRTKRPRMGRVAERLADRVVVTSDNPRSEEPGAIIAEILRGIERPERVVVEPERRAAIARAIGLAGKGDIVLIAGKGHETYQILKEKTVHFDDREVAREALVQLAASASASTTAEAS
jgi:UDP-N-acetylmuramoyl-L-alanyl-D-glutamate--2,6-diaminopimelate ligase